MWPVICLRYFSRHDVCKYGLQLVFIQTLRQAAVALIGNTYSSGGY